MDPHKSLGLDPQKSTKMAVKLHAHPVQYAYKYVLLIQLLSLLIIKDRNWVLLSTLLIDQIPIDFCFKFGAIQCLGLR